MMNGQKDDHNLDGQKDDHNLDGQKDDHNLNGQKDDHNLDGQKDDHNLDGQKNDDNLNGQKDDHNLDGQKDYHTLDIPDSTTGLTARERKIVVDTWGIVRPKAKQTGVEMFTRLFEAHPQYQKLFPNFEGLTLSELRTSKKLAAHATNVMYSLTSVIDNLDDPGCLKELLVKLGKTHGRRKVTEKQFYDLELVLMQLLKDKLGNQLTSEGENAWKKTVDIAYKGIFEGLKPFHASNVE